MLIDAVVSGHLESATSGVTRFNQQLAARLRVPHTTPHQIRSYRQPLISVKARDTSMDLWIQLADRVGSFAVWLHDVPDLERPMVRYVITHATRLYAANPIIARRLATLRPDIIALWCPATITGDASRAPLNILTFGMAHKLQLHHYERLHLLLGDQPYTLSLSTAVHEGSPWSDIAMAGDQLRTIFGSRLRTLGYLLDDALARELAHCSAVALFFDPALRANNTTFWAVCQTPRMIITNLDADSPLGLENVVCDITQMTEWHLRVTDPRAVAARYSWDALIQQLRATAHD